MSGLIGPNDADARYVGFYGTGIKSVNDDGSVDAKVSILPAGQTVDPWRGFNNIICNYVNFLHKAVYRQS